MLVVHAVVQGAVARASLAWSLAMIVSVSTVIDQVVCVHLVHHLV